MKTFTAMTLLFALTGPATTAGAKNLIWQDPLTLERLSNSTGSVTAVLENIAGDTYYAKFNNGSSDTYRVFYKITDGGKTVQDETSTVVRGNSSNSNGPYHCSPRAIITITKTERI